MFRLRSASCMLRGATEKYGQHLLIMTAPPTSDTPRRLGSGMIVAAWILILLLLTAYFSGWLEGQQNPNHDVSGTITDGNVHEVVLEQNRNGHYVATGRINDRRVTFLLDTGATTVSVPASLARAEGLHFGPPSSARTANGTVTTYDTLLDRVELGNIVLHNVPANINPGMHGSDILLGMSFLRRIEFTQRGKTLTLRQTPGA